MMKVKTEGRGVLLVQAEVVGGVPVQAKVIAVVLVLQAKVIGDFLLVQAVIGGAILVLLRVSQLGILIMCHFLHCWAILVI